jgi:hypothetical protein
MMGFRIRKNEPVNYFEALSLLSDHAVEAAEYLEEILNAFDPDGLGAHLVRMHEIEHQADQDKHEMLKKLTREFLPPIDKDDLILLSHDLDDVIDNIEEVLIFIDLQGIEEIREEVRDFAKLIVTSCKEMKLALEDFENYRKSEILPERIEAVNRLKSKGKNLYIESLKTYYGTKRTPVEILIYTELFRRLESCTSSCKIVTNTLERIVIKNL